jgi:hypothetical protein
VELTGLPFIIKAWGGVRYHLIRGEGFVNSCISPICIMRSIITAGLFYLLPSDPICLSTYVYKNEFDYLLNKDVPSYVPSSNKRLDSSGVNGTPIHNKGLGRSTLPSHSRRRIC